MLGTIEREKVELPKDVIVEKSLIGLSVGDIEHFARNCYLTAEYLSARGKRVTEIDSLKERDSFQFCTVEEAFSAIISLRKDLKKRKKTAIAMIKEENFSLKGKWEGDYFMVDFFENSDTKIDKAKYCFIRNR